MNVTTDVTVSRGNSRVLNRVEGDLRVEDATLSSDSSDNTIYVTGSTFCSGDCTFNCNLKTESLEGQDGDIIVEGNLEVGHLIRIRDGKLRCGTNLSAERVDVDKRVDVSGNVNLKSMDVDGSVNIEGDIQSTSINVGGGFKAKGKVNSEKLDVGGSAEIGSEADIGDVDVGGRLNLAGGVVHTCKVGGKVESSRILRFERLKVGGKVRIAGGEGGDIHVGGSLTSDGDLTFGELDVGGKVEIKGDATGRSIEVGGKVNVSNNLVLSDELDVGGVAETGGNIKSKKIKVGGEVKAMMIEASDEIESHTIISTKGVKAQRIRVKGGEVQGTIMADDVVIEEDSRVEDIIADRVELQRDSRAKNIYAADISIESGCSVSGEIQYTSSLKRERNVDLATEPKKVQKLEHTPSS